MDNFHILFAHFFSRFNLIKLLSKPTYNLNSIFEKLEFRNSLLKSYLSLVMLSIAISTKNLFDGTNIFLKKINLFFKKILVPSNKFKVFFFKDTLIKPVVFKNYLIYFNAWLYLKRSFNTKIYYNLFKIYNSWIFYLNYSLNYYLFFKLYFSFFNYFFYIICQKFMQISLKLGLKSLELVYDFSKAKDNIRYYQGINPQSFVTTFNRRVKKGSLLGIF
jgi:hypothetical protein